MAEEPTESAPGTALVNALNQTGLPQTVKGKVQRLVLRMFFGGPGFEYYEKAREKLDIVEGRSRISAIVADELGRQAILNPEFMERAKARLIGEMAQKQENVEAIAAKAQAKVEAMPDADATVDGDGIEPSQDWLNVFTQEAELASSDELRDRLADVLAGEARNPGTYSKATVRFVGEAERETLEAFSKALKHRVGDAIVRDKDAWNSGEWLDIGMLLETEGLITGSEGFTSRTMTLDENGNGFFLGERAGLVIKGTVGLKKSVSVWLLTRLGKQVASLLPSTDELAALRRLASLIGKDGLTQITFGPQTSRPGGGYHIAHAFIHWSKEHDEQEQPTVS